MRQVGIDNIEPGSVTARHVYAPGEYGGIPLLAAKVTITEGLLKRMGKAGITSIMVEDELSAGIDAAPSLTNETRQQAITVLRQSFEQMGRGGSQLPPEQIQDVESVISRIISEVATRKNLLVSMSDMNLFGGDRMQHALDVCVVGAAVAKQFFRAHGWRDFRGQRREDGIEDRMVKLGVGMLLQDIGTLAVPDSIREKRGILTAEERAIMQQHPLLGLELLEGSELSPLTKVTIAQHHERYDGSGYPRGLAADDIHDHGQLAAIAEAYVSLCDETTSDGAAFQPHEAYRLILQARNRLFRAEIVDAFAEAIAPYGPGTTVQLSDGRYGIVIGNNAGAPLEPILRVTHDQDGMRFDPPVEVDLRRVGGKTTIKLATNGLPGDPAMRPGASA
ncbi:MAG: metal dependent phosphohydrolase [Thermoleophilia bacterium]|nr:metal dependent phosphohydrolase [Thermoleophilia bacterium]